jgi:hypothetical protein
MITRKVDIGKFDSRNMPRKVFFSLKFIPVVIILLVLALVLLTNFFNKGDFTGSTVDNDMIKENRVSGSLFVSPLFYFGSVFVILVVVIVVVLNENRRRKRLVESMEYIGNMDMEL